MHVVRFFFGALFVLLGSTGLASAACEGYKALSDAETKEFRDKLLDTAADSLDRLFAFQKLVCSDNPVIRAYAVREGLKSVTDPLVREQIMFDAMFEKTRIDIDMVPNSDSSEADKNFSSQNANLLSYIVRFKAPKDGCLGLYNPGECNPGYAAFLKGDKVEIRHTNMVGSFQLSESNELIGFVRAGEGNGYGRIPAVIKLF